MKKEWKAPQLELLEIRETMARSKGDSYDGFLWGRYYSDPDPKPDPEPTGS